MSTALTLIVPGSNRDLVAEIQSELSPYMRVRTEASPTTGGKISFSGIPEVKLVIEIATMAAGLVGALATTAGQSADALQKLLDVIDRLKRKGRGRSMKLMGPSGETKELQAVDASWLEEQLG